MRKIFFIILALIIAGSVFWYFSSKSNTAQENGQKTGLFKNFFPIGGSTGENEDNQVKEFDQNITIEAPKGSLFKKLSSRPVAGFSSFTKTKTISTPGATPKDKLILQTISEHFIRYVDRQSGYVYEIKGDQVPTQISNIFIPSIYEAFFIDDNNTAILRFLRDDSRTIASYSVPIPPENTDGTRTQKEGVYLLDNIKNIAISSDQKELIRLTQEGEQSTILSSNSIDKNKKELLRHPLKEWLLSWVNKDDIFMQTKTSGVTNGFLYKLNTKDRRLVRVLGDINGLTTSVSPSGNFVFYSQSTLNGFVSKILNTKTGETFDTGLSVLPEKCSWLKNEDLICAGESFVPQATYPDAWYAGIVSFSDKIIRVYTQNNTFDVIYSGDEETFDMTNLQVNEQTNKLFFIDKNTGFLWEFSL